MHLSFSVRPATRMPYCVEGGDPEQIARSHACVRDAEEVIRAYCREQGCSATMRIYTPRNRLWCTKEIGRDGSVSAVRPEWLMRASEAAREKSLP